MHHQVRREYVFKLSTARAALCAFVYVVLGALTFAQAAPGSLEPTFGGGGQVQQSVGNFDHAYAAVLQPDGKIVVGGTAHRNRDFLDFILARFNPNGTLDTSFGTGGIVDTYVNHGVDNEVHALLLQPDGKIIAVGSARSSTGALVGAGVVRYNPDGSLDPTFGAGGIAFVDAGVDRAAILQPDGKIVCGGGGGDSALANFQLARLDSNGQLDPTFGTGGKVVIDFNGSGDGVFGLALQTDGKIVAAGRSRGQSNTSDNFAAARVLADGNLDTTFGTGGKVTTDFAALADFAFAVVIQPDGKIVLAGQAAPRVNDWDFGLVRYNPDGSLDPTFGTGGKTLTPFNVIDAAYALKLQPNGRLVAAGVTGFSGGSGVALARYNPDGNLDTTFGAGGTVMTLFTARDEARALLLQPDGKIVAAGTAEVNTVSGDFALARYLGDPPSVLISEFRFSGPAGDLDEFVELYNNTDAAITVQATDGSEGWMVAALGEGENIIIDAITIPNGTIIPARGHYLATNSGVDAGGAGYSMSAAAAGDLSYRFDLPDSAGIALFSTTNFNNFAAATRLDAAGFTTADALYREGAGLQPAGGTSATEQYSWVRKQAAGTPQDTGDNANDFTLVSTAGLVGGAAAQLGAPGPENSTSPIQRNAQLKAALVDPQAASTDAPNRVRDFTPVTNGSQGTLTIRRKFTNKTGQTVTALRFCIVDITTLNTPNPGGAQADLRAVDSLDAMVTTSSGSVLVRGTTLDQPPAQASGGGLNSALVVALPGGALAPNASINVQFTLGVQQSGRFRFIVNVEALTGGSALSIQKGGTKSLRR